MPVTPFHYPIAYITYKLGGKINLSLPALIVGSMVPDLEVPILYFLGQPGSRLVLHSLIGALTIGTIISIALTVLVYPHVTSAIFPINKQKVREKCKFSDILAFSCLLGCISHVLLDLGDHSYNPIFWPFIAPYTSNPIVQLLGGNHISTIFMHALMVVLFIGLFYNKRNNFWEHVLVE